MKLLVFTLLNSSRQPLNFSSVSLHISLQPCINSPLISQLSKSRRQLLINFVNSLFALNILCLVRTPHLLPTLQQLRLQSIVLPPEKIKLTSDLLDLSFLNINLLLSQDGLPLIITQLIIFSIEFIFNLGNFVWHHWCPFQSDLQGLYLGLQLSVLLLFLLEILFNSVVITCLCFWDVVHHSHPAFLLEFLLWYFNKILNILKLYLSLHQIHLRLLCVNFHSIKFTPHILLRSLSFFKFLWNLVKFTRKWIFMPKQNLIFRSLLTVQLLIFSRIFKKSLVAFFYLLVAGSHIVVLLFVDGQKLTGLCIFLMKISILNFLCTQLKFNSLQLLPQPLLSFLKFVKFQVQLGSNKSIGNFDLLSFFDNYIAGNSLHFGHLLLMSLNTFLQLKLQPLSQPLKSFDLSLQKFILILIVNRFLGFVS